MSFYRGFWAHFRRRFAAKALEYLLMEVLVTVGGGIGNYLHGGNFPDFLIGAATTLAAIFLGLVIYAAYMAPNDLVLEYEGRLTAKGRELESAQDTIEAMDVSTAPQLTLKADDPDSQWRHFTIMNLSDYSAHGITCEFDPSGLWELRVYSLDLLAGMASARLKAFSVFSQWEGQRVHSQTEFDCRSYLQCKADSSVNAKFSARIRYSSASGIRFISHLKCSWSAITEQLGIVLVRVERVVREPGID